MIGESDESENDISDNVILLIMRKNMKYIINIISRQLRSTGLMKRSLRSTTSH